MGGGKRKVSLILRGLSLPNKFDFNNINTIEIETFSYCNRKCWFCPNSIIDRHSNNIEMDENVYLHILEQLQMIGFEGKLSFSRYNEPLSQKELILKRIKQAREFCPRAVLATNTNGDYLTRDYINELSKAGLDYLNIQCYLAKDELFDIELMEKKFELISERIGLQYEIIRKRSDRIEVEFTHPYMTIVARARDFTQNGCTRGDSLETIEKKKRQYGCLIPYTSVYIDYNGKLVPCCNIRSDFDAHKPYILGDCTKESLEEIFNNKKYLNFRKRVKVGPCVPICKNCSFCDSETKFREDYDYIMNKKKK